MNSNIYITHDCIGKYYKIVDSCLNSYYLPSIKFIKVLSFKNDESPGGGISCGKGAFLEINILQAKCKSVWIGITDRYAWSWRDTVEEISQAEFMKNYEYASIPLQNLIYEKVI